MYAATQGNAQIVLLIMNLFYLYSIFFILISQIIPSSTIQK